MQRNVQKEEFEILGLDNKKSEEYVAKSYIYIVVR